MFRRLWDVLNKYEAELVNMKTPGWILSAPFNLLRPGGPGWLMLVSRTPTEKPRANNWRSSQSLGSILLKMTRLQRLTPPTPHTSNASHLQRLTPPTPHTSHASRLQRLTPPTPPTPHASHASHASITSFSWKRERCMGKVTHVKDISLASISNRDVWRKLFLNSWPNY
ncbi:hypothetical protein EYF80_056277 [Liparis tanakae]|uniref:Uncharacterized protein n=1 Tax=Liparis tanakae TaxID=230148 RepID=A0A4Z2EXL3_9TELE|nr:hypothetical protein EYF80_056277 [Liparis tanakae]